jgi:hypothetical protein
VGVVGTLDDELDMLVVNLEVAGGTFGRDASEQGCLAVLGADLSGSGLAGAGWDGWVDSGRGVGNGHRRLRLGTSEQRD